MIRQTNAVKNFQFFQVSESLKNSGRLLGQGISPSQGFAYTGQRKE
jgi:hypothetical protein